MDKDLLTLNEFAKVAGIAPNTAKAYRDNIRRYQTPVLPPPDRIIGHVHLWYRETAEAWAKVPRPPGRPKVTTKTTQ